MRTLRHVANILAVAATASIFGMPIARAAGQTDSQQTDAQGHVKQHQDAVPPSRAQDEPKTRRDQSAEAPNSPAVIAPPATGDRSVITPPATGEAKTPVITPPGSTGHNEEIQPK